MRILLITDYLPYPPISGDTIRVYNLLKEISKNAEITLLALFGTPNAEDGISHCLKYCHRAEVIDHQWPNPLSCLPDMLLYFIKGIPFELRLLYSQKMADLIYQFTSEGSFDIVQIEHSRLAFYKDHINPSAKIKSFLTFHNVAYDQFKRIAHIEKTPITSFRSWMFGRQLTRWEPRCAESFDHCLAVSEVDRENLLSSNPRLQIDVIPNGTDTRKYQVLQAQQDLPSVIFIGSMSYAPCVDGVIYFFNQILPRIKEKIDNINFWIVGARPVLDVLHLARENIHVTGYVEDILPYYRQASVSVVPLRAGGGTRLKILESMALGRPVISTTIGCEGLEVVNGQHLLVADDPEEFAEKTIQLLTDRALYNYIVEQARRLVVEKYDWKAIADKLLSVYTNNSKAEYLIRNAK